jgi:hypothetical protein
VRVRIHVSIKLMGAPQTCTHKSRGALAGVVLHLLAAARRAVAVAPP